MLGAADLYALVEKHRLKHYYVRKMLYVELITQASKQTITALPTDLNVFNEAHKQIGDLGDVLVYANVTKCYHESQ